MVMVLVGCSMMSLSALAAGPARPRPAPLDERVGRLERQLTELQQRVRQLEAERSHGAGRVTSRGQCFVTESGTCIDVGF